MEGFIKVSATDTGLATEVKLAHISGLDKVLLLNAFAHGLDMDDKELGRALMIMPLARGFLTHDDEEVSADE